MSQTLFYNPFINFFFFFLRSIKAVTSPSLPGMLWCNILILSYVRSSSLQCDCIPGQSVLVSCYVLTLSLSISGISSFPSQEEHGEQSAFTLCRNPSCPRMGLWVHKVTNTNCLCTTSGTWEVPGSLFIPCQVAL